LRLIRGASSRLSAAAKWLDAYKEQWNLLIAESTTES